VTGMVDPHMPLLAEIRAVRARLGTEDVGDWRALRCPLSPCLASVFLALDEETAGNSRVSDILIELERLCTALPELDRLRAAPLLDMWSVRRMDDGCLHLFGQIIGHPRLPAGTEIFTAPYLRLDRTGGWARTRFQLYRLGRFGRGSLPAPNKD
jgi:hypothetical protein